MTDLTIVLAMTPSPRPKRHPGVSPDWSNLPRRKCDDCGKTYKPKRPKKDTEHGFCSDNCRKSFHKHGGAYRKLRGELRKLVEKEFGKIHEEIGETIIAHLKAAHREDPDD